MVADGTWFLVCLGGLGHEGERVTWALVGLEQPWNQNAGCRVPKSLSQRNKGGSRLGVGVGEGEGKTGLTQQQGSRDLFLGVKPVTTFMRWEDQDEFGLSRAGCQWESVGSQWEVSAETGTTGQDSG